MNQIRHRSPKTENSFSTNYFKSLRSPRKKEINFINSKIPEPISKNSNINNININNNQQYNFKDYNYYDEIQKAFNFITFILQQKDNQIMTLKKKIIILQQKLNHINSNNIRKNNDRMSFNNNKELIMNNSNIADNISSCDDRKNNSFKTTSYNCKLNEIKIIHNENDFKQNKQFSNSIWSTQTQNSDNNTNINSDTNSNNTSKRMSQNNIMQDNNNINIIHKIKKMTNKNDKINNYSNNTEIINKHNYNQYNNSIKINNNIINNQFNVNMNMNINEHSNEKKNINQIRKEPYHIKTNKNNNNNIIVKMPKDNARGDHNSPRERDISSGAPKEKLKILFLDNSLTNAGNSKSNSFSLSDDGNILQSKNEVKNYLKEVKNKLEPDKFKKFISLIKCLIKNKNNNMKNKIIYDIKNILIDKYLINKFDVIMKIK